MDSDYERATRETANYLQQCVDASSRIAQLEAELVEAKADVELLTACNESMEKSTSALWRILAPEYEGDSSIQEMASVLMKALANALKDSRRLDELESIARPTLVDGCGEALTVALVYYVGHTLREAIDVMQGKEGEP